MVTLVRVDCNRVENVGHQRILGTEPLKGKCVAPGCLAGISMCSRVKTCAETNPDLPGPQPPCGCCAIEARDCVGSP